MKRSLLIVVLVLCLLLSACGQNHNCPKEVIRAINDYLSENYSDYTLNSVEERNTLLYSFSYTVVTKIPVVTPAYSGEDGSDASDEYARAETYIEFIYSVDGKWKITNNFGSIPGHIMRGEAGDTAPSPEPTYDCPEEVLDTFNRWADNMSADGDGDWELHVELCYWGDDFEPSYPGISFNTVLTREINSVTRVNDGLYEIINTTTDKYRQEPLTYQHFVCLIEGEWKITIYEFVPDNLSEGLENCDQYVFTENGIEIIPANVK